VKSIPRERWGGHLLRSQLAARSSGVLVDRVEREQVRQKGGVEACGEREITLGEEPCKVPLKVPAHEIT